MINNSHFHIADAHTDYLYGAVNFGYDLRSPKARQRTNLADFTASGTALQVFAAWMDDAHEWPFFEQFSRMTDAFDNMLLTDCDMLVRFDRDFDPSCGLIAAVLSVEGGGELLRGNPDMPHILASRGVKAFSFTWNNSNAMAHGAGRGAYRGLTAAGKDAVGKLNDAGIAIDVSHLNDAGIDDVLSLSNAPVFASHSNSRAVCRTARALKNEHISEIARSGGVVCVNYYPKQLCRRGEATIYDVVDQIEAVASIGGIDSVGLGSDFDGMQTYPRGLERYTDVPELLKLLSARGMSDEDISKVAYYNLAGYLKRFH